MKVILLKDVPKIGKKHEIKEVSDGYAANFLLPKKLVEVATPSKVKEIEALKKTIQIENQIQEDLLMKNLAQINGLELVMKSKTSEAGHLFKAIRAEDIAEVMKKIHHIDIAPNCIVLDKPIKQNGDHIITVKVKDKKTTFKLVVEKE